MPEKVRLLSDPILRKPCVEVDPTKDAPYILGLIEAMNETMRAEGGMGLAANQIGRSVRVFILKENETFREYINPQVVRMAELVAFEGEACLSIPGTSATTKRYKSLELVWFDRNGNRTTGSFEGVGAFAVQHEIDHLDGKLYVDQFGPVKRDLVVGKHRKYLREVGRR